MSKLSLSGVLFFGDRLTIPNSEWQPLGDRAIDPSHPYGTNDFEYACTPLLSRLPSIFETYRSGGTIAEVEQEQEVSRWLTGFWDEFSCGLKQELDLYFYKNLDPETCDPDNLDWLASVLGFQEDMFSPLWTVRQKRAILGSSHTLLFPLIGSARVINFLLRTLNVPTYTGWRESDGNRFYRHPFFKLAASTMPSRLGRKPLDFYIRIPLSSVEPVRPKRAGTEFDNAELIVRNYTLAQSRGFVSYDYFYVGISALGDPLFNYTHDLIWEAWSNYQKLKTAFSSSSSDVSDVSSDKDKKDDALCFLMFILQELQLNNFAIWRVIRFRLGLTRLPAPLPFPEPDVFLIAPDDEPYSSDRWNYVTTLAGRIIKGQSFKVCHRFFRPGISRLGIQPMFSVAK